MQPYSLPTEELNALALAFQSGQTEALAEIYQLAESIVTHAIKKGMQLDRAVTLDRDDLAQEMFLAVANLARRWKPAGGDFAGYLIVSLPFVMRRLVKHHTPTQRSTRTHIVAMTHDQEQMHQRTTAGTDGRAWADQLVIAEMLEALDPLDRRIVVLAALCDQPLTTVARRIGVSIETVQRRYRSTLAQMSRGGATASNETRRFVEALYAHRRPDGRLPGRTVVCRVAGLTETHYHRLMARMLARACVVDRNQRYPGRLTYQTAQDTLHQLTA